MAKPKRDARGRFVSRKRKAGTQPRRRVTRGKPSPKPIVQRAASGKKLGRQVRDKARAVRTVGEKRLKPGLLTIGRTKRLTPTHRGFAALDDMLLAIQREHGTREAVTYRFDMELSYRDSDGNLVTPDPFIGMVIPDLKTVRRRKKKGESDAQAFRRLLEMEIKYAAFRIAREAPDIADVSDKYEERMQLLEAGDAEGARDKMREIKSARGLTFRLAVHRVIP